MKILISILILVAICAENVNCDLKLLILHNNDMHGRFVGTDTRSRICKNEGPCYGGFARIKKTVDDIRERQKNKREVIFLNAGDTFQGTIYYTKFKSTIVSALIDKLGFDAMALGNHEFDEWPIGLVTYLKSISTVTLAANIDTSEEPEFNIPQLRPYKILNVKGHRIAVIGYVTPQTQISAKTGKIKFLDEIESIKKQIEELKKENITIFFALGHSGFDTDIKIAKYVPDIDVVIGGHSHTFLYNGTQPDIEKPKDTYPVVVTQEDTKRKVLVVTASAYTKYLGYLEVDFDNDGEIKSYSGNPILLDKSHPEDQTMLNAIQPWKEKLGDVSVVIGRTKVILDNQIKNCKLIECNLGNLITDAMVYENAFNYVGDGWTDAPISIIQAASLVASINTTSTGGNITLEDIYIALPYEDEIYKAKIKGIYLRKALEHSVHRYETTYTGRVGEFLQLSGIIVTYDVTKEPGNRVSSVKVRCALCDVPQYYILNDNDEYELLLSKFLAMGGDNYTVFKENLYDIISINTTIQKTLIDYIRKKSPVYPTILNRITVLNNPIEPSTTEPSERTTSGTSSTAKSNGTTYDASTTHTETTTTVPVQTTTQKSSANTLPNNNCALLIFTIIYLSINLL